MVLRWRVPDLHPCGILLLSSGLDGGGYGIFVPDGQCSLPGDGSCSADSGRK